MKRRILLLYVIIMSFSMEGQKTNLSLTEFPIPKSINQCFVLLDKTMPIYQIELIKKLPEDSIFTNYEFIYMSPKYGAEFFRTWNLSTGSKLTRYFNRRGLKDYFGIYKIILVSYHRYLNGEKINLQNQIKNYKTNEKIAEKKRQYAYLQRLKQDSINGVYIPKDIEDCFIQLDKLLSSDIKQSIKLLKDKKETIQFHNELGMWIRNNWGLWSGSRLQQYFLEKKITQPDEMSALIIESYYDWLNNKFKTCTNE